MNRRAAFRSGEAIQRTQTCQGDLTGRRQRAVIKAIRPAAADEVFDVVISVGDINARAGDVHRSDGEEQIHCGGREVKRIRAAADGFKDFVASGVVAEDIAVIAAQAAQGVVTRPASDDIGVGVARQDVIRLPAGDIFNSINASGGVAADVEG